MKVLPEIPSRTTRDWDRERERNQGSFNQASLPKEVIKFYGV